MNLLNSKNVGIEKAQTDYIVYCDDDNIVLENHLEVMYNEMSKGTKLCGSNYMKSHWIIGEMVQ